MRKPLSKTITPVGTETFNQYAVETEITQAVNSMEIDHQKVQSVGSGMDEALQVADPVHVGDKVYKVVES
jgi:hypothetical protein